MYQLVMHSGPTPGKVFPLEKKEEMTVGRELGNDIVISDPEMSRRHARIFLQGSNFVIEDLGSTNGTFVNGQRLMGPYVLHAGETVVFGENIQLMFEVTPVAATEATLMVDLAPAEPATTPYYQPPTPSEPAPENFYKPPAAPVYGEQAPYPADVSSPTAKKKSPVIWIVLGILLLCICCVVVMGGMYASGLLDQFM